MEEDRALQEGLPLLELSGGKDNIQKQVSQWFSMEAFLDAVSNDTLISWPVLFKGD